MRVLMLTHRLPFAPNRGDRVRSYHILEAVRQFATVDVVSLVHDEDEAAQAREMRRDGVTVYTGRVDRRTNMIKGAVWLPTRRPLTLEILHSPEMKGHLERLVAESPPDVVLAYCSSMARYALEAPLRDFPFVLDIVDVDSEKWRALAKCGPLHLRPIYSREAYCLARFERVAIDRAAMTLVVNEREERLVRRLVPDARVRVMENGVDLASLEPPGPPSREPVVVFCGVMNYEPNVEAARRLALDIWPRVLSKNPAARLVLLGAWPTPEVRAFGALPGITVTGQVPDVRPYLWDSAVAAVPLVTARGIQNKVLEALATGLPAVVSPVVAAGIPSTALAGCQIAASDEEFADEIVRLLAMSPECRRSIAMRANLPAITWERQFAGLMDVLELAARRGPSERLALFPAHGAIHAASTRRTRAS